jgi:nucleoside-diphosphate-sugar epimerase
MLQPTRKLFIAGSTGAVGRTVVALADVLGLDIVPHVRPARAAQGPAHPKAAVFELGDTPALLAALKGCTTVLQLIGTMRSRFSRGDTYETSDIATTRHLVEAAKQSRADHFVLLSSVGAGSPMGAYLAAKAKAEALVTGSGLPFTVFRPSTFVGEGHRAPPGFGAATRLLGLTRYQPIEVTDLAAAIVHVARARGPLGATLEGKPLWEVVEAAKRDEYSGA